ncbi:MAG: DEAD/DEAH box helicase [Dehalococcoidales bacterium]|jgi:DEAD/DEAH box helicase domain-containing protein|nr:DEAD/DEAH box helicase [Dehalococcoidales bacterium]
MNLEEFLAYLVSTSSYQNQVSHIEHIVSRPSAFGELEKPLPENLQKTLEELHMWPLYTHQAEAIDISRRGENVIISTPSASGKSLAYNIPVLEALQTQPLARALYLFPTKALARDQLRSLNIIFNSLKEENPAVAAYDGDTPYELRNEVRNKARLIITNPDMLHIGMLPRHGDWARFFTNLKYVILDEAHVYRGVFGSNVALVLRRLRRLCRYYGAKPVFIFCSATIANPCEHAEALTGLPFQVVDNDGSPAGERDFVFWNPPLEDPAKGARKSSNSETSALFAELVSHNIRSLVFTRSRRLTELIYTYTRDRLKQLSPVHAERIQPYRAGYMPEVRRQVEAGLSTGKLMGVVATNALELGIDIGHLDVTVISGYPGTISSTWQQAGRSGRSGRKALTIMVGRDDPLDQYLMNHPEAFFKARYENALINPENPYLLGSHLLCAAWEHPLSKTDAEIFGKAFGEAISELETNGALRARKGYWYADTGVAFPARGVDIRSSFGPSISIVDTSSGSLIDSVERSTALFQAHPGAVYLNQGESYLITELDLQGSTAKAQPVDAAYYTVADDLTTLRIIKVLKSKQLGNVEVCLGRVEVTTSVIAYKRKEQYSEKMIDKLPLDLPDDIFTTVGLWFDVNRDITSALQKEGLDLEGGLHATEHASIGILPLFAMCDRNDIGGVSTALHMDTGKPQVFIYDAHPGGIGIAEKGYEIIMELWAATLKVIKTCKCEEGCPSCIQSPKCGNNNEPLDKKAAERILSMLLY